MDRRAAGLYAAFLACRRRRRAAMPDTVAPGVYVEEAPAGAHVIAGVPTSVAAFLGATASGPVAAPRIVRSFAEFETQFGALAAELPLGYAVQQYFVNGGRDALIARIVPSGPTLTDADLSSPALEAQKRGLWLLDHAEHFNILCIPPLALTTDVGRATWDAAVAYATRRRAMVIVDPPAAWTAAPTMSEVTALLTRSPNAALYYPRLQAADPLRGNQVASFAPCGAVAGIYARTDASRGVWKAPAGAQANVLGVAGLSAALSDAQLSALNAMGSTGYVRFPVQSFCGARARSRGTTSRTRSNSFRCGASTCSSRTASRAACKGPPSSRTGRRCGSASARALRISCSGCSGKARCRATNRSKRFSCAATPRP